MRALPLRLRVGTLPKTWGELIGVVLVLSMVGVLIFFPWTGRRGSNNAPRIALGCAILLALFIGVGAVMTSSLLNVGL